MNRKSIFAFLIGIILVLFIYYNQRTKVLKDRYSSLLDDIETFKNNEKNYNRLSLTLAQEIEYISDDLDEIKISNINSDTINFLQLQREAPILIFRFKETNCESCYENQLGKLETIEDQLGDSSVILLVSFENAIKLKLLQSKNHITLPIYNIKPSLINKWPFERYNQPYFLTLKDSALSNFFLPEKTLPDLTELYFDLFKTSHKEL